MDFTRLKYFVTIADTGSMRRAAEILHVSAPALSKATRILEDELGVALITQDGRNILLTDHGKRLAARAGTLLKDVDSLRGDLEKKTSHRSELKIATFEVFSTYFLSFLNKTDWDDCSLVLHEVLPGELERSLRDGAVDFGITYMPVPTPEIEFLKICSIPMGVFTQKEAFPGIPQVELPFVVPVLPITGAPSRIRGLDGWPDDAYPRKVKYQVTLMESALELCRQGRAAGYFPQFIVEEHNQRLQSKFHLVRRPSPYGNRVCVTDVFIAKRKSDLETQHMKRLAKAIRLVCQKAH